MVKKKFVRIGVTEKTEQEIKYTAKVLNKSISGFLEELFDMIIQQSANFKNGANLTYLVEYNDLRLRFSGSKVVQSGCFKIPENASEGQINDKIKEEFKKGNEN